MSKYWLLGMLLIAANTFAADVTFFPARPGAPFSEAVQVDGLIFLSGRLGIVKGKLVEGGIEAETHAAMKSIEASLKKIGSSMDRVAKCTVFIADMGEFGKMNAVYKSYFGSDLPARSAVEVGALAFGASVEIECIAATGD